MTATSRQAEPIAHIAGWGGTSVVGTERRSEDLWTLTCDVPLSRGLGRSYGDSSLPPVSEPVVAGTVMADRLLAFDEATGDLTAEAGYSLRDLWDTFLPRGWFTPVSPGTQFVTLGGMVAADVHGKNHHREGSIGAHVRALTLRVAGGERVRCSRETEPDLFRATIGGMGLTGHLLEVTLRLVRIPSPWIFGETRKVTSIDEFIEALKKAGPEWPFTMGWIDCLKRGAAMGRGVLYCGRWATVNEAPRHFPRRLRRPAVPFDCPSWVMGRTVGRVFNSVFYRVHRHSPRGRILHPESFFYPLDAVHHWNRLYGRRGFTQYQCVLPEAGGAGVVRDLLDRMSRFGAASFLCVIKDCGAEGEGLLSFPLPGVSVALDLPIRDNTQEVVDALNEFVVSAGGRVYLAKDAYTRPEHYRAMEPRLAAFEAIRRRWDPQGRIRSAQSVRLLGDQP
ncbi:MAG: FAD-binding oxidoreductase [Acidobacteria bacterium]|nr:FAD-binding oxidoreductase [Acidobacteriota bacterium]